MVLDLLVHKTDDGYDAEVPSVKGCESWAHTEDEVIAKITELIYFYLRLPSSKKIIIDKARRQADTSIYKIIFDKD